MRARKHRFGVHSMALPMPLANVDTYLTTLPSPTWSPTLARFVEVLYQVTGQPRLNG
ncbi:hypothetical protein GCM10007159_03990 [Modicisalibacter luteus]|nr:hypothetical protein GCM10007159_03990 [Halomonas lutea]